MNKFEEALDSLTEVNNHIDLIENVDYEQLVMIRASSDQLRNNID